MLCTGVAASRFFLGIKIYEVALKSTDNGSIIVRKRKSKAVPLHAMVALGGRGGIAPTHS
jgi:hypothetical protein